MPPPIDLQGLRFGELIVLRRDGTVKFGKLQSAWLCRCDCGAEIRLPLHRIHSTASTPKSHTITACDECRSRPCIVCGNPISPMAVNTTTCSTECKRERAKENGRAHYYHRIASNPKRMAQNNKRKRDSRAALSPGELKRQKELDAARYKRRMATSERATINARSRKNHHDRMINDKRYRNTQRVKAADWREKNPDKVREALRESRIKKRKVEAERQLGDAFAELTKRTDNNE